MDKNSERIVKEELFELLRFKSISADSTFKSELVNAAEWIKKHFQSIGLDECQIFPTQGHPVVFAQKIVDESLPTVLVYGHYDVQPPDPLELWDSDPFEPIIRDEKIYGRGTADDKGQFFMIVKSVQDMLQNQSLPCNVKFIIEGEEEIGSVHLPEFIQSHAELLKADVVLIADNAMMSMENPSIDVSCRGIIYYELEIKSPNRDLHSGTFGGAVENPIKVLSKILAQFHDENHHVLIPGFYDDVVVMSEKEKKNFNQVPFSEQEFSTEIGIKKGVGEADFSTLERIGIRPTFEINGIVGGYYGEGAKTVMPSKAMAKVSMRLVAYQNAKDIEQKFERYLKTLIPDNVEFSLQYFQGSDPYILESSHPGFKAGVRAIEKTFHKPPHITRGGGSIPIVSDFEKLLGIKSIFLGFGLHDDNLHSPNEKFNLFNFFQGIETFPYFFRYFAEEFRT